MGVHTEILAAFANNVWMICCNKMYFFISECVYQSVMQAGVRVVLGRGIHPCIGSAIPKASESSAGFSLSYSWYTESSECPVGYFRGQDLKSRLSLSSTLYWPVLCHFASLCWLPGIWEVYTSRCMSFLLLLQQMIAILWLDTTHSYDLTGVQAREKY